MKRWRNQCGHLLVELAVALSIGVLIMLQLSTFMVTFVRQMNALAVVEQRALQEGAVLDLLMRDLDSAVNCQREEGENALITLTCWRMREHEKFEQVVIRWYRVQGRLQRKMNDVGGVQVFGAALPGLTFDVEGRVMRFVDEHNKVVEIAF